MISELRVGDEVLTAGGIYGTVTQLDDDEVTVEIAPKRRGAGRAARDRGRDARARRARGAEERRPRARGAGDGGRRLGRATTSDEENRG